jgi:hypothetical protein
MESERSLAFATVTHEPQEGRTGLARAVEAVLSDVKFTERPKELSIKAESAKTEQTEEQPRTTAQGGFEPINPGSRRHVIIANSGREPPITASVVRAESQQQKKPVLKHLDLGSHGLLGLVIQNAIEAARYQDEISSSDSTVIETTFRDYPITVTANSDPVEVAVEWACHRERKILQKYHDQELRAADEALRKSDLRQSLIAVLNFFLGAAVGWMLSLSPGSAESGAHILRLLHGFAR